MQIGGHRGCGRTDDAKGRRDVPQENSQRAIDRAFAMGADFIETDLCLDGEGRGWLVHSAELSLHIEHPPADYLDQLTSLQVSRLVGFGGLPLMPLEELLAQHSTQALNLEIKLGQGTQRSYQAQIDQVTGWDLQWPDRWCLSSFDPFVMDQISRRWPNQNVAQLSLDRYAGDALCPDTPDAQVQSFNQAKTRPQHWRIHAEAGDHITPTPHSIYVWSLDINQTHWPQGIDGIITDRLEDFLD